MHTITLALSAFFEWILQVSWQASFLAAMVLAAQWVFRRRLAPHWRFALWFLVLARLALPTTIESRFSMFNATQLLKVSKPTTEVSPAFRVSSLSTVGNDSTSAAARPGPTAAVNNGTEVAVVVPQIHRASPGPISWLLGVLPWLWFGGVLFMAVRLARQNIRFGARLRTGSRVTAPEVFRTLRSCGDLMRLRRVPELLETDAVQSPAIYGIWRPRLLLPGGMMSGFSLEELRFVFLHELGHLKRHDMATNCLMTVFQLLHWFNPALWFAFNRMRADRELACDALVLSRAEEGASQPYGETILRILSDMSSPAAQPGLVGILEDRSQMKDRIRMIARFRRRPAWSGIALALIVGLGVLTLTDAQTSGPTLPTARPLIASVTNRVGRPLNHQPPTGFEPTTNLVPTSVGSQLITAKLQELKLGHVEYKDAPLLDVAQALAKWSRDADPEKRGLNFIVNPSATGANLIALPITLRLGEIRLGELLDAIVQVAPVPIKYSVEEYAVVFSERTAEAEQLFTRTYKVDPNTFVEELDRVMGTTVPAPTNATLAARIRRFFIAAGVDFPRSEVLESADQNLSKEPSVRKGFFYSERTGLFLVRATLSELDVVEKAVQMLNATPPQVRLEARLVEISQSEQKVLGFDWFLGNTHINSTASTNHFPGQASSTPVFPGSPPDAIVPAGPRTAPTLSGILTDPQFRVVRRALEQRTGSRTVCNPTLTALSGRQTRMGIPAIGFTLDTLPTVLPDGISISVDIDFSLEHAVGPEPRSGEPDKSNGSAKPSPLRVSTRAVVWDGQTMVLGAFPSTRMVAEPEVGEDIDAPARLVLFITPTIIDPAGNRVHAGAPTKP